MLKPGDHPFIQRDSVVYYEGADVLSLHNIQKAMDGKAARWHTPFDSSILKRIQEGLIRSPHTLHRVRDHYRASETEINRQLTEDVK